MESLPGKLVLGEACDEASATAPIGKSDRAALCCPCPGCLDLLLDLGLTMEKGNLGTSSSVDAGLGLWL